MPQQTDLIGAGVNPLEASMLGNQAAALTAKGTTQGDAAPVLTHLTDMTATGADGIVLPLGALIGTPYYVFNSSGSNGTVYAPLSHTMNTTLNGSLVIATHKLAIFIQFAKGKWASILTA